MSSNPLKKEKVRREVAYHDGRRTEEFGRSEMFVLFYFNIVVKILVVVSEIQKKS